jgi:pimeloyl-ACP methyl ester carboxylesterase
MPRSASVDDFSLAYNRSGSGPPVLLLLHGWPGDRGDYRALAPLLDGEADVVVPDLRGSGSPTSARSIRGRGTRPWRRLAAWRA